MAMSGATISLVALLLFIMLSIIILACKPWRFFLTSVNGPIKDDNDLSKPLVSEEEPFPLPLPYPRHIQSEGSPHTSSHEPGHACNYKDTLISEPPPPSLLLSSQSLVLDVVTTEPSEALLLAKPTIEELSGGDDVKILMGPSEKAPRAKIDDGQRSRLTMEVISGPSIGLHYQIESTNSSELPLTIGRIPPSDVLVKDSEVSGKHAMIRWNSENSKWEVVDMGSLNGTFVNSHAVHHVGPESRRWGAPTGLANGDDITLGGSSKIRIGISAETKSESSRNPFSFGVAVDPMAIHKGGKKLPMEDACFCEWPLRGVDKFGLFGICDGHGGAEAAKSASRLLAETVGGILREKGRKETTVTENDASEILRRAFRETDSRMSDCCYEGCTATLLLVWSTGEERYCIQCANVGDSACIAVSGEDAPPVRLTEDHRISSLSERLRIDAVAAAASLPPLRDGETRLCGINVARMLGDRFLRDQDPRFTSDPYVSPPYHVTPSSPPAYALLASDGLWDVMTVRHATRVVARVRHTASRPCSPDTVAAQLVSEAKALRTKDNTSVIFIDFASPPPFV